MDDPFNLQRFVTAQDRVIDAVRRELKAGRKTSHWMWFVFPQITGLGGSPMAHLYAITSRAEASAYLGHPILGARLRECAGLVLAVRGRTAKQIFGAVDEMKLGSSMTLFAAAAPWEALFAAVLHKYFAGRRDAMTLERI